MNRVQLKDLILEIIKESPDTITKDGIEKTWQDDDAVTFGYYKNKFYCYNAKQLKKDFSALAKKMNSSKIYKDILTKLGKEKPFGSYMKWIGDGHFDEFGTHRASAVYAQIDNLDFNKHAKKIFDIYVNSIPETDEYGYNTDGRISDQDTGRKFFKTPGRLWTSIKSIGLWGDYNDNEFKKLTKDLKTYGVDIVNGWYVETNNKDFTIGGPVDGKEKLKSAGFDQTLPHMMSPMDPRKIELMKARAEFDKYVDMHWNRIQAAKKKADRDRGYGSAEESVLRESIRKIITEYLKREIL